MPEGWKSRQGAAGRLPVFFPPLQFCFAIPDEASILRVLLCTHLSPPFLLPCGRKTSLPGEEERRGKMHFSRLPLQQGKGGRQSMESPRRQVKAPSPFIFPRRRILLIAGGEKNLPFAYENRRKPYVAAASFFSPLLCLPAKQEILRRIPGEAFQLFFLCFPVSFSCVPAECTRSVSAAASQMKTVCFSRDLRILTFQAVCVFRQVSRRRRRARWRF